MASIIRQFTLDAPAAAVWDAVADFGALHTRLVPGFVTATAVAATCAPSPSPTAWSCASGSSAWTPTGVASRTRTSSTAWSTTRRPSPSRMPASGSRATWITDVLPDAFAAPIAEMMDAGAAAMQRAFASAAVDA